MPALLVQHDSALEQPQVIRDYLAIKGSEGCVLGLLDLSALPQVHISRFGVIPKDKTGKWHGYGLTRVPECQ